MPTVLIIFGIRFYFFLNDHEPIHIHVEHQGKTAKIQLEPEIVVIENKGIKPKVLKKALDTIYVYQDEMIEAWHEAFD